MAKLFDLNLNHADGIMAYANDLTFVSRLVYWQAGWNVFNQYPWFGVGLGKVGFFLNSYLSGYAWRLDEVRDLVYRSGSILNIKSLWVRLLAETGIVGFSLFAAWLFGLWQTTKIVENTDDKLVKSIAWAGKFVLIGLLLEGFSVDTFALPYFWLSFGLLTASMEMIQQKGKLAKDNELVVDEVSI
jgi:O-antigen ligase